MPVYVKVSVFGDSQLKRRLDRFKNRPRNLAGAYEQLKPVFFEIERRQFDSQGSSGSGGWAALKPSTLRSKAGKGQQDRILRDTDSLFNSLTSDGGSDWAGHFNSRSMFFGTVDSKAKFHQKGTKYMTKRKPVDLTATNRREMVKVFQRWLVQDDRAFDAAQHGVFK